MRTLTVRSKHTRRLEEGHPWVFANEIADDLKAFAAGEAVHVRNSSGKFYGSGYVNPRSLIAARILTREKIVAFDEAFFAGNFRRALARRASLYPSGVHRLVHSEADGLPGLVVDRYVDTLVVEIHTAGMERLREAILAALDAVLAPRTVILKNDSPFRAREGLPSSVEIVKGEHRDPLEIPWLDGAVLRANLLSGQKTGLFLDQRDNVAALRRYLAAGARVLDMFCYAGAWSVMCARYGAGEVLGVDRSEEALACARANAEWSGVEEKCRFERAEALDSLKALGRAGERFDVVLLDPPAFAKTRKDVPAASRGLIDLNIRAARLVQDGGVLVSSDCSHHVGREAFREILAVAMRKAGRRGTLLEWRGASADHPSALHVPESEYLKCAFVRVEG